MTELLTLAASTAPGLPLGITEGGTWLLRNVWLIPLLPALSFVGILFFGKRMPRGGSELGIALVGIAFVLSLLTAAAWSTGPSPSPSTATTTARRMPRRTATPRSASTTPSPGSR